MRYRLLLDSKKNGISVGRVNLSGPTIKKPHFFMCVFPMWIECLVFNTIYFEWLRFENILPKN